MAVSQRIIACRTLSQLVAEAGTLISDQLVIEELIEVGGAVSQLTV